MNLEAAESFVLEKLKNELADDLYYHSVAHTLDVTQVAESLARHYQLPQEQQILIKTAALFHDCGFTRTYSGHEEAGCGIVREVLPGLGYDSEHLDCICAMIMTTKIPQAPKNIMEEIICDADLDYLGRDDFLPIGNNLFRELSSRGIIEGEEKWNRLQVSFLDNHKYWTAYSREHREPKKQKNLLYVQQIVAGYDE